MQTVYFVSLGCSSNRVDTEVMLGCLQGDGYTAVNAAHEAELIVVNTCGFVDVAKQESIDTIFEMAQHKLTGRCRTLVVAGCLSQGYAQALAPQMDEVDCFIGVANASQIGNILRAASRPQAAAQVPVANDDKDKDEDAAGCDGLRAGVARASAAARVGGDRAQGAGRLRVHVPAVPTHGASPADSATVLRAHTPRQRTQPAYSVAIKISEGCSHRCAFCVVPTLRGVHRSRPMADILAEARRWLGEGVSEINLVAQDVCAYGTDSRQHERLSDLLAALDRLVDAAGLRVWIRCSTAYPKGFTPQLLDVLAGARHVLPYVDLPLQHIADPLLRRMRRGVGEQRTRELVSRLRASVPKLTLRTTFITGLPSESDEDFALLYDFVRDSKFERLSVFTYSPQDDTPAARMLRQVEPGVALRRRRQLLRLQRSVSRAHQAALCGQRIDVLVDGVSEETDLLWVGRHAGQAPDIDGKTYITGGQASPGQLVTLCVEEAHDYDVAGQMVQPC